MAFGGLSLALASAVPAQPMPPLPAHALILFGAHWCAPCTAELRDLDSMLARLALLAQAPDQTGRQQIALAWIDRPLSGATVTRVLERKSVENRPLVVLPPPALAAAWAEPLMASAHGLPFAAMTDARGKVCALHQGVLRAADIADLSAACHRAN